MLYPPLDILDGLTGIGLATAPIDVPAHESELNDEVAGEVLRLDPAPFLAPKQQQSGSSVPMTVRASEPPMKKRRPTRVCPHI